MLSVVVFWTVVTFVIAHILIQLTYSSLVQAGLYSFAAVASLLVGFATVLLLVPLLILYYYKRVKPEVTEGEKTDGKCDL